MRCAAAHSAPASHRRSPACLRRQHRSRRRRGRSRDQRRGSHRTDGLQELATIGYSLVHETFLSKCPNASRGSGRGRKLRINRSAKNTSIGPCHRPRSMRGHVAPGESTRDPADARHITPRSGGPPSGWPWPPPGCSLPSCARRSIRGSRSPEWTQLLCTCAWRSPSWSDPSP